MVERADFAELAGLWDQRFRRHFQMQLQQPPCIHQVPNCCPCCCCCAVYLTIPSLSLSCRWTEVVSTTPFMLICCCCCCFQQLSSMLPLQQQRQSWHCGCTSCPDSLHLVQTSGIRCQCLSCLILSHMHYTNVCAAC